MSINKEKRRLKIRKSIRAKISGTKERPQSVKTFLKIHT